MYSDKTKFAFHAVPVIIGTFIAALLFNAIYQVQVTYRKASEAAQIAAFVRNNYESSSDELKRSIMAVQGVSEASFVDSGTIYQNILNGSSKIKDIMLNGENPFSPYFLIRPETIALSSAEAVKANVLRIKGIEEIRYDSNLFSIAEKLKNVKICYFFVLVFAAGALLISAAVKIIYETTNFEGVIKDYLLAAVWGILFGLIGIMIYYFFTLYIFPFKEVFVPVKYLLLVWPTGIFLNIVLND